MPDNRRTDLVLLLVAIVWGSSYLAAKAATGAVPVLTVLFVRYALAGLAAAAVIAAGAARRPRRRTGPRTPARLRPAELRYGSVLGLTQAAVLAIETYGVAHTSAANAGLIISLTIVLTPLLDRTGGRGPLPGRFFAAAGLCVLAVGLLMSGTGLHTPGLGDLLMLAAAVVRAAHVALVGHLTAGRDLRPMHLTAVQTAVGTAVFAAPAAAGLHGLAQASAATWGSLLHLALFCSVFAFLAQTWAVQRSSASRASLLLGTEPVWAVAVGIGLGGERLTAPAALGAVLMVAGTYWGQAVERTHRTAAPAVADRPAEPLPSA
ncbi:DMT family transporter [Kitasatospora sp. DSM 101779]|uniref:DMT family transporter n=1 Tax=Kitasatospora sp. DSM 101779 TaxID=2853165 RepID=UPI0021D9C3D8|nr:DMT family transporter [Kitasatospora sp. DSM 101779]MCU7820444.1 DMT family transporter [Kitasatospora sp. DSM 101779]